MPLPLQKTFNFHLSGFLLCCLKIIITIKLSVRVRVWQKGTVCLDLDERVSDERRKKYSCRASFVREALVHKTHTHTHMQTHTRKNTHANTHMTHTKKKKTKQETICFIHCTSLLLWLQNVGHDRTNRNYIMKLGQMTASDSKDDFWPKIRIVWEVQARGTLWQKKKNIKSNFLFKADMDV